MSIWGLCFARRGVDVRTEDDWCRKSAEKLDDLLGAREDWLNHEQHDDDIEMPSALHIDDSNAEEDDSSNLSGESAFADEDANLPDVIDSGEPVDDVVEPVVFIAGPSHDAIYEAAEKRVDDELGPMLDSKIRLLADTLASAEQLSMTKLTDQCRRGYVLTERSAPPADPTR